jgi:hypothetical protein
VELFATSVIPRVFQFEPSGDHSKVSVLLTDFLAAHNTVILLYPADDKLFEYVIVLELLLEPAAALLPPENWGVGEELEVLMVQVLLLAADQPAGKAVPVPKFSE